MKMTYAEALAHLKSRGMVPKIMYLRCQAAFAEMRRG